MRPMPWTGARPVSYTHLDVYKRQGLLCAAETYEEDTKVYEMTETQLRAPLEDGIVFSLPDGTILHESSSVTVPEE